MTAYTPLFGSRMRRLALAAIALSLASCSTRDAVTLAMSRNPEAALSSLARSRATTYVANPQRLVHDIKRTRREFNHLVALLSGHVDHQWGHNEVVTPSNKRYVKYTQNYKSRAIVEFDKGLVRVETLDQANPSKSLQSAIVTTLLTPDDPRAVDLYSDRTVRLSGTPYLYNLVTDQAGRPIATPREAARFARYLLAHKRQRRTIQTPAGSKRVEYVELRMVNGYENRQARRYAPLAEKYGRRFGVSPSLVMAVMKTESAFNPFAVSSAPAYGLMQLVPATAGRDAFKTVKGYDHTPSRAYLFNSAHNIELGTAYLGMIEHDYLNGIANPVSREYCTIAAYNGGAGNVLRLFSRDRNSAPAAINRLSPSQVYAKLRYDHPRAETRRYLGKVLDARREFVNL